MALQPVRGTRDILPEEAARHRQVVDTARRTAALYGFAEMSTPVFEFTEVFARTLGDTTDVVTKEMYTFEDRSGDSLTLRPEGTAPVCRAYLEHGLHNLPQPVRMYYVGPFFRYDRPQAGRYRQLHQFGIEAIGDGDSSVDVEVMEVAWRFLESVGLSGLSLGINSIGDAICRPGYVKRLQEYYRSHLDEICSDCKARLDRNPLRVWSIAYHSSARRLFFEPLAARRQRRHRQSRPRRDALGDDGAVAVGGVALQAHQAGGLGGGDFGGAGEVADGGVGFQVGQEDLKVARQITRSGGVAPGLRVAESRQVSIGEVARGEKIAQDVLAELAAARYRRGAHVDQHRDAGGAQRVGQFVHTGALIADGIEPVRHNA